MKVPRVVKAMEYIDEELITAAEAYKPQKNNSIWVKWVSMAACLCLVVAAAVFFIPDNSPQLEPVQTISYNGFEYWVCGAEGEAAILKECGLPDKLTADLAGKTVGYLKLNGENSYEITNEATDIPLFEYAPQPNENVYILEIDGDYYAAIRRNNGNYQGLPE